MKQPYLPHIIEALVPIFLVSNSSNFFGSFFGYHNYQVLAYRSPYSTETEVALRKLLESKDAAVRAGLEIR